MRSVPIALALILTAGSAVAQSAPVERDRAAGSVATDRAGADFQAARRDEAIGAYGQAAVDRSAGRIARRRADRDVLAGDRNQLDADRARIQGR